MKSMLVAAMLMLSAAAHAAQPLIVGASGPVVTPLGDKAGDKAVCAPGNGPDWDVDSGTYVSNHAGPESYAMLIDLGGGCYSPGATQATRPPASMPSNGFAGGWIISIPWNPACLDPSRPYFVIMTCPETGTGVVGPYVDSGGVTPCRSWRNAGSGWTDVASEGFVGHMRIWTDVNCCNEPVPVDDVNWGTLKSMFR